MHIRNDPSFFLTNKTGAPQGEELGRIKPLCSTRYQIQILKNPLVESEEADKSSGNTSGIGSLNYWYALKSLLLRLVFNLFCSDMCQKDRKSSFHVLLRDATIFSDTHNDRWPASTVSGQMANPSLSSELSVGLACVLPLILLLLVLIVLGKIIILSFPLCLTFQHECCPWHGMSCFRSSSLNMGIPPYSIFSNHRVSPTLPQCFEVQRLHFHEFRVEHSRQFGLALVLNHCIVAIPTLLALLLAITAATPWSIKA
ncbi:hypothetical protein Tco_0786265 [Tanacetum coccineum]